MTTIVDVVKAMKLVSTNQQAQSIINGAIAEVKAAQRTGNSPSDLKRSLGELEAISRVMGSSSRADFASNWEKAKPIITRAYVNVAGAVGEFQAREAVSLLAELGTSAKDVASGIGEGVGTLAGGVGNVAGSVVGGLLKGLGPLVVLVLALVVYFRYAKK